MLVKYDDDNDAKVTGRHVSIVLLVHCQCDKKLIKIYYSCSVAGGKFVQGRHFSFDKLSLAEVMNATSQGSFSLGRRQQRASFHSKSLAKDLPLDGWLDVELLIASRLTWNLNNCVMFPES